MNTQKTRIESVRWDYYERKQDAMDPRSDHISVIYLIESKYKCIYIYDMDMIDK